ncbi:MAG: peptidoglycan DD-metalloendopeptidase family protein [Candidatus Aminicenantes bacterium]|nr:peptidoglycan DD-metalloendopeptidase family protein [Candidatus Aminicenantes bacterium]
MRPAPPISFLKAPSGLLFTVFLLIALLTVSMNMFCQEEISVYQERLEKLQAERARLQQNIKDLDKKKTSILSQLDQIGLEKKLIQNDMKGYSLQMEKANRELSSVQKKIPPLKARLEREKESVSKILVTLYKFGDMNYLDFMFRSTDIADLMSENKHLTLLAQYQEDIILSFKQTLNELKEAEEQIEAKKQEIAGLLSQSQNKKKDLDSQERKNRAFIQNINQDKKTHLKTLEEIKVRAEQLQNLINRLIKEKSTLPFTVIPLYEKKGSIPWPILGKVVTNFGIEQHPTFKTVTENNGIEISAEKNAAILAIHPGKVVYADYFQGFYGNLIILDHGLSYYSMYGHCSDFKVQKGDIVTAGQPIAVAGDTGSLKGTALYFQINFKADPLNPLQWLKGR